MALKRLVLPVAAVLFAAVVTVCSVGIVHFLNQRQATDAKLTAITEENRANGQRLVDCVTPNPHPAGDPDPGCWDRLHDPHDTDTAVALIVDNIYCDQRRAQHHLPAVTDPRIPCRAQTDPSIYPGGAP